MAEREQQEIREIDKGEERSCARCAYMGVRRRFDYESTQCNLRSCTTGPYCWLHTRKSDKLRVLPSTVQEWKDSDGEWIPERKLKKGLFVTKDIEEDKYIATIGGETIDINDKDKLDELDQLYRGFGAVQYQTTNEGLQVLLTNWTKSNSGNGRYVRVCSKRRKNKYECDVNVELVQKGYDRLFLKTTRNIGEGEELFLAPERKSVVNGIKYVEPSFTSTFRRELTMAQPDSFGDLRTIYQKTSIDWDYTEIPETGALIDQKCYELEEDHKRLMFHGENVCIIPRVPLKVPNLLLEIYGDFVRIEPNYWADYALGGDPMKYPNQFREEQSLYFLLQKLSIVSMPPMENVFLYFLVCDQTEHDIIVGLAIVLELEINEQGKDFLKNNLRENGQIGDNEIENYINEIETNMPEGEHTSRKMKFILALNTYDNSRATENMLFNQNIYGGCEIILSKLIEELSDDIPWIFVNSLNEREEWRYTSIGMKQIVKIESVTLFKYSKDQPFIEEEEYGAFPFVYEFKLKSNKRKRDDEEDDEEEDEEEDDEEEQDGYDEYNAFSPPSPATNSPLHPPRSSPHSPPSFQTSEIGELNQGDIDNWLDYEDEKAQEAKELEEKKQKEAQELEEKKQKEAQEAKEAKELEEKKQKESQEAVIRRFKQGDETKFELIRNIQDKFLRIEDYKPLIAIYQTLLKHEIDYTENVGDRKMTKHMKDLIIIIKELQKNKPRKKKDETFKKSMFDKIQEYFFLPSQKNKQDEKKEANELITNTRQKADTKVCGVIAINNMYNKKDHMTCNSFNKEATKYKGQLYNPEEGLTQLTMAMGWYKFKKHPNKNTHKAYEELYDDFHRVNTLYINTNPDEEEKNESATQDKDPYAYFKILAFVQSTMLEQFSHKQNERNKINRALRGYLVNSNKHVNTYRRVGCYLYEYQSVGKGAKNGQKPKRMAMSSFINHLAGKKNLTVTALYTLGPEDKDYPPKKATKTFADDREVKKALNQ